MSADPGANEFGCKMGGSFGDRSITWNGGAWKFGLIAGRELKVKKLYQLTASSGLCGNQPPSWPNLGLRRDRLFSARLGLDGKSARLSARRA